MDLTWQRYYQINRALLSILGLWPYQSRKERYARVTFFIILVWSQIIPQIFAVVEYWDNPEIIIQSISPFVTDLACITKGVNIMLNIDKMFQLVERMRLDWLSLANSGPQLDILHGYAGVGSKFTLAYATGMYCCLVLFMGQPAAPKLLEALNIINGTGTPKLPFPMYYYGFDMDTYYYCTLVHATIVTAVGITTIVAADTMFLVYVQHACAMFSVLGYQLEQMASNEGKDGKFPLRREDDAAYQYLVNCIKKHKRTIEFGDLIESSYTWAFFSFIGFNMIMMSVTGYQTVVKLSSDPEEAVRYGIFTVAQMLHLFFQSFFSERLRSHSDQLRQNVYRAQWPNTSPRTRKLISFMIMRTFTPCTLTAGKVLVMSLENFTSVVKTSMSYFTLLRSMQ